MMNHEITRLRPMLDSDLELVLSWRNHPDIRRYMYTQHEISLDEHTNWFNKASMDPTYSLLIFEVGNRPLGFVNIQIIKDMVADWGFYTSPDAPKGIGLKLGKSALDYAFNNIGLHKLCGQALGYNEASKRFHLRLGFNEEGLLKQHHFDGHKYHDVICFGLIKSDYKQINR